jgi:hypothetical protein
MYDEPTVGGDLNLTDSKAGDTIKFDSPGRASKTIAIKTNMRDWLTRVQNVEGDNSDVSWCKASKNSGILIAVEDNFERQARVAQVLVLSPEGDEFGQLIVRQKEQVPILRLLSNTIELDTSGRLMDFSLLSNIPHDSINLTAWPKWCEDFIVHEDGDRGKWKVGAEAWSSYTDRFDSIFFWSSMVKSVDTRAKALKVNIRQRGRVPAVTVDPPFVSGKISKAGQTLNFTYTSDVSLQLQTADTLWVKFSTNDLSKGSGTFTVTIAPNHLEERSGKFLLAAPASSNFRAMEVRFSQGGNLFTVAKDHLTLPATDLTTNAQHGGDDNNIKNLVDGKNETFFHSTYSGTGDNAPDSGVPHYIQIALPQELQDADYFAFDYTTRNGGPDNIPVEFDIMGSATGQENEWHFIRRFKNPEDKLPTTESSTSDKTLSLIYKGDYRQIRFVVLKTNKSYKHKNSVFFHLAELRLYTVIMREE